MRHVVTVLTIAVVALSLYACGKKGAASGSPVVGTWKVVEASGTAADMNKGMVYDFKDSGELLVGGMTKFAWTVTNDTLYWNMGESFKFSAKFKISGDTMNLDYETSDQKFVMKKQ